MKTYAILKNSEGNLKAVKFGFNWVALFIPWLWGPFKGLFLHALPLGVAEIFWFWVYWVLDPTLARLFTLGLGVIHIIFGIKGNDWVINGLLDKGYEMVTPVDASSSTNAIAAFKEQEKKEKSA